MIKIILVSIVIFNIFLSCTLSTDGNSDNTKNPIKVDLSNAKTLFIGTNQESATVRNILIQDNILYKVDVNGNIIPVEFSDENGDTVQVQVFSMTKKNNEYFASVLSASSKTYNVLVEVSTGKIFDLGDDVDLRYGISPILGKREIVYGTMNSGVIYKFNLDTLTATPLNNPSFDHISGYFWYFEDQQNAVFAFPQVDNTIIVNDGGKGPYKLDLNAINPPQKYSESSFYNYPLNTAYPDGLNLSYGLPIFTNDQSIYSFEAYDSNLKVTKNGLFIENLIGASISDNNVILDIPNAFAYSMNEYYIYKSGLLYTTMSSNGGLDYHYLAKDLSFIFEPNSKYYRVNDTIYCLNGDTFKKTNPVQDLDYSIIYTSPKVVNTSWMMNEDIYFSAYNTATDISTFIIRKD